MNPKRWGPHAWYFLYSIVFNYPDYPTSEDVYNTKAFFDSLGNILPCYECRINYKRHISEYPLTPEILGSRELMINWLIKMQNLVNESLGKPFVTRDEIVEFLESNKEQSDLNEDCGMLVKIHKYALFVMIIISIVTITIIAYYVYRRS